MTSGDNEFAKNLISYSPSITYEDSYYSEKKHKDDVTLIAPEIEDKNKIDTLEELIEKLENLISNLPGDIQDMINNVFDPVKDFVEDNKDMIEDSNNNDSGNSTDNDNFYDEDDSDDIGDDDDIDFSLDDNFTPVVNIIKEEISVVDYLKDKYKKNLYDLLDNYFNNLLKVVENYWTTIATIALGKDKEFKKFLANDLAVNYKVDKSKQHILDLTMRSQIYRQQKSSFASKNFAVDETITKLRAFKMSNDLMLRYIETDIKDTYSSRNNEDASKILEACLINYNGKYNTSYMNLYKYLNSSTVLSDNVLQLMSQEVRMKQYLK